MTSIMKIGTLAGNPSSTMMGYYIAVHHGSKSEDELLEHLDKYAGCMSAEDEELSILDKYSKFKTLRLVYDIPGFRHLINSCYAYVVVGREKEGIKHCWPYLDFESITAGLLTMNTSPNVDIFDDLMDDIPDSTLDDIHARFSRLEFD